MGTNMIYLQRAQIKVFTTKISAAKKLQRSGPKSDAVKKFLDKKKEEEDRKKKDFVETRDNLFSLRAKDRKANKRVKAMINRTLGANKAVLEDAKDTAIASCEVQCDEDDYGYESIFGQQMFASLADKYASMPEEEKKKFNKTEKKDLLDIKNRVISSLKVTEEENLGIRKRSRKSRKTEGTEAETSEKHKPEPKPKEVSEEPVKRLKNSKKTIPVNLNVTQYKSNKFDHFKYDKSKTATKPCKQQKQSTGMSFEQLLRIAKSKKDEPLPIEARDKALEEEHYVRPLTAREKQEFLEERMVKLKRVGKLPPHKLPVGTDLDVKHESTFLTKDSISKDSKTINKSNAKPRALQVSKLSESAKKKFPSNVCRTAQPAKECQSLPALPDASRYMPLTKNSTAKSKVPFQNIHKSSVKQEPSNPSLSSRKPVINSDDNDEEYDSEMSDFIDDGEEELDYSKEIRKMFGYDKRKFMDDDDVDDMEATFADVEREERISTRIGIKEDLEDIAREEKERKLKLFRKKKMAVK